MRGTTPPGVGEAKVFELECFYGTVLSTFAARGWELP